MRTGARGVDASGYVEASVQVRTSAGQADACWCRVWARVSASIGLCGAVGQDGGLSQFSELLSQIGESENLWGCFGCGWHGGFRGARSLFPLSKPG